MAQRGRPATRSKNVIQTTKIADKSVEKPQEVVSELSYWQKKIIEVENSGLSERFKNQLIKSYRSNMGSDES